MHIAIRGIEVLGAVCSWNGAEELNEEESEIRKKKQYSQRTKNVTLRRVRVAIVAVRKHKY